MAHARDRGGALMPHHPDPEAVFICRWRDRLATAAHSEAEAVAFVREMAALADKLEMSPLRSGFEEAAPEPQDAPAPKGGRFVGFLLEARRGGRCAVCKQPFGHGEQILWRRETREAAHSACGSARR